MNMLLGRPTSNLQRRHNDDDDDDINNNDVVGVMTHQQPSSVVMDDDSSEPTPVPTTVRPPPPQQQQQQQYQQDDRYNPRGAAGGVEDSTAAAGAADMLNSTLMSFSVDGGDDTLPSLAIDPPSPLSRPSDSLMVSSSDQDVAATSTNVAANSLSRRQQQQPKTPYDKTSSGDGDGNPVRNRNIPPIHEVVLDEKNNDIAADFNSNNHDENNDGDGGHDNEDDTFFECIEDRSLAQRAKRSLQQDGTGIRNKIGGGIGMVGTGTTGISLLSEEEASSGGKSERVLLSSPDGQPTIPRQTVRSSSSSSGMNNNRLDRLRNYRPDNNNRGGSNRPHQIGGNDVLNTSTTSSAVSLNLSHQQQHHQQQSSHHNNNHNISSDDVVRVHESALHALQQLKEELVKSNQRNQELMNQYDTWQKERSTLVRTIEDLQHQTQQQESELSHLSQSYGRLQEEQREWSTQQQQLLQTQRDLESQVREGARDKKEYMHRKLATDNRQRELRGQIDKLRDELEDALARKGELAAELVQVQTERMDLEAENTRHKTELADATQQRQQYMDRVEQLEKQIQTEQQRVHDVQTSNEQEIDRLNTSLRKANDAMHRLRAEMGTNNYSKGRSLSSATKKEGNVNGTSKHGSVAAGVGAVSSSTVPPPTLDSAIADRLARLRDSAERAHLIRGHKREIARLKAERDATIHRLEAEHADAVKKVTKQAEVKRNTQLDELTKKLQDQHEAHVEEVEDAHRKRISELQKDHARLQEDSDESLQEALSRAASMSHKYERETARRLAAEKSVENLHRQMEVEKKESHARYVEEIEKRRHDWESERETILVGLQKDCNTVFDQKRRHWSMGNNSTTPSNININTPHSAPLSSRQQQQQHQHPPRPSPLSVNSVFFPETKMMMTTVDNTGGMTYHPTSTTTSGGDRANFIAPSPSRLSSPLSDGGGGPPSMISQTYSDIDSVLRETEEFVHSIL